MSAAQKTPFDLPGLTLPLDFKPIRGNSATIFANALDSDDLKGGFCSCIFTLRELYMMRMAVTDKLKWDTKICFWDSDLYRVIEQIIARPIPLWNVSLTCRVDLLSRIHYECVEYPSPEPEPEDEENDDHHARYEEWNNRRQPKHPEPYRSTFTISFRTRAAGYCKLASIELTPDKPEYEGGAWHIEGQLNERICATAIYYYDSENITENTLSFRHRANTEYLQEVSYEQGDFKFLRAFGFEPDVGYSDYEQATQELGGVSCRVGRLLTFPNTLQHRVSPFSLADRSKPGHRKILALFLIDPTRRIISTANVSPQREDWWNEWAAVTHNVLARRLPIELQAMVRKNLDFTPMAMDEAKAYRLELMDERSLKSESENERFTRGGFSLCEH
ncbi:hypothetical protein BDW75DRAFT_244797 [Aspergillus navahoensis]